MRSVMGKFDVPDAAFSADPLYTGGHDGCLTAREARHRQQIADGSMPYGDARRVLIAMNPNTAMRTLSGFAQLLAAVVRIYPERMDVVHTKTTLRKVLLNAPTPDRFHWYMNNVRYRSTLPNAMVKVMASGTTRNEQLHARLHAHYRVVSQVSRRMLAACVKTWLAADTAESARILAGGLSRKMSRSDMLPAIAASMDIFSAKAWSSFAAAPRGTWATLPLATLKKRVRRRGPTAAQGEIYDAIRAKTAKRQRVSMFGI